LHETLALADAVKQMVERLAMFGAMKKKTRVRRDVERHLLQSIKFQIHARFLAQSMPKNTQEKFQAPQSKLQRNLRSEISKKRRRQIDD
jgi:hypothetical protein